MEKKVSLATYLMQLTIILLFLAILCFPLALMALDGPDLTEAESEASAELVPLNADNYFSGKFHSAFETWFSHHYPMRSSVVTIFKDSLYRLEMSKPAILVMDLMTGSFGKEEQPTPSVPDIPTQPTNPDATDDPANPDGDGDKPVDPMAIYFDPNNMYAEINLKQWADTPIEPKGFKGSDAVYIGKSGYLFERAYIDEYYGFTAPYNAATQEGIEILVERLQYIQDELEDRYGITMLYVISSSKASQYEAYIPDHYKNRYMIDENYVRPVDMLRPLLAESSINYLDSSEYYKEIGLLVTFPKTGIHWNHLASFESTAQLVRMYNEISGKESKLIDIKSIIASPTLIGGGNSDRDVFNILYGQLGDVPGKIEDEAYYYPEVDVTNKDAAPLNVFVQGGSFTGDIIHYLTSTQVANVRSIYYNGHSGGASWGNDNPWTKGTYVWEDILDGLDLIIFEQTEQQIRSGHATGNNWPAESADGSIGSNAVYDSLYMFLKETE
jgi:hypothetical protein